MKRVISVILLLCLCLTLMAGCKKEDGPLYNYKDLSKYVTVGEVVGLKYKLEVAEVTDKAVTDFVNSELQKNGYGEQQQIKDRAVANGDTVNIDYKGIKDGVAFQGGTATGADLTIGSGQFIPGFEEGLVGAMPGETKNLNLTFPENYHNAELAGAAVVFEVKVNYIKGTVFPELTDTLVAEISDKKTVDEYREYAKSQVLANNQNTAIENANSDIWSQALATMKFNELPKRELEYFKDFVNENYEYIAKQNGMTLDDLIKQAGLTEEQYEQEIATEAEGYAKHYLANYAIARKYDIEITDAEYATALENYAKQQGYASAKEAEGAIDPELLRVSLVAEKVLNYLVENAKEA